MKNNVASETISMTRIHLAYLFDEYDCKMSYLTTDFGDRLTGIALELSSPKLNYGFRLYRLHSYTSIGIEIAAKEKYSGWKWEPLHHVVYILSGKRQKHIPDNPAKDLEQQGKYIKPYLDEINNLFTEPMYFEEWVHTQSEIVRHLVTVEKVRKERARLEALGLDSSMDAAIKNLRGKYDA